MTSFWPRSALLLPLLLVGGALLLASCSGGGYRNPCDSRATYEARPSCNNSLIDFDRQLRGNRSFRTL